MILNKLSIGDKKIFDKYLRLKPHGLSAYAFANIYIWNKFFDIRWVIIRKSLCVFFKDKIGAFLYLSPLAVECDPRVVKKVFEVLIKLNLNPGFAHIENIEAKDLRFYRGLGFDCSLKSHDYLCLRTELESLQGNRFKSKRASCNYFKKNFKYSYRAISLKDRRECLELYSLWAGQRKKGNLDHFYQALIEDSRIALEEALDHYSDLGFKGVLVMVEDKVKAFTFGFEINKESFCILYEITDLTYKGLAQFIFSCFCGELKGYRYINIMDDSCLENLKKVKLSYHPEYLIPAYIARKNNG
ncbi:MAG: phosphatidylglycerol lysyltransferase domain-containing protein [Candidatus Omnitrophica bacterium]|nr:phosphatidylglycerol lysyltransferase domain-containing protein [Candidatus Omnitrophota bacterium]